MIADVESSDEVFRAWMYDNLERAATHFGLVVVGEPTFGWRLRSVSAGVHSADSTRYWLRVGSEQTRWLAADADFWTGSADANVIEGVAKPRVLDSVDWDAPDQGRRVRADVMTALPGCPCSPTDALHGPPEVPGGWWDALREALGRLRGVPTTRYSARGSDTHRVHDVLGVELRIRRWETVHGDLHWNNLLGPQFGILDWELWGRGPVATDAASLYCYSLTEPATARRVWMMFADVLDTDDGHRALLWVAARLLHRAINLGDYPELTAPLRALTEPLLANYSRSMSGLLSETVSPRRCTAPGHGPDPGMLAGIVADPTRESPGRGSGPGAEGATPPRNLSGTTDRVGETPLESDV